MQRHPLLVAPLGHLRLRQARRRAISESHATVIARVEPCTRIAPPSQVASIVGHLCPTCYAKSATGSPPKLHRGRRAPHSSLTSVSREEPAAGRRSARREHDMTK